MGEKTGSCTVVVTAAVNSASMLVAVGVSARINSFGAVVVEIFAFKEFSRSAFKLFDDVAAVRVFMDTPFFLRGLSGLAFNVEVISVSDEIEVEVRSLLTPKTGLELSKVCFVGGGVLFSPRISLIAVVVEFNGGMSNGVRGISSDFDDFGIKKSLEGWGTIRGKTDG